MPDTEAIRLALAVLSGRRFPLSNADAALLGDASATDMVPLAERTILDTFAALESAHAALSARVQALEAAAAAEPQPPISLRTW